MNNGAYAAGWTGRLTRDPDIRFSKDGNPWVRLSVAVNSRERNAAGEWVDNTTFWTLKAWRKLASNIADSRGLVKGTEISFSGSIKSDTWTDKEGAERRDQAIISLDRCSIELSNAQVHEVVRISGAGNSSMAGTSARSSAPAGGSDETESHFGSPWDAAAQPF
jgi:single stranded DNA-binding protein